MYLKCKIIIYDKYCYRVKEQAIKEMVLDLKDKCIINKLKTKQVGPFKECKWDNSKY